VICFPVNSQHEPSQQHHGLEQEISQQYHGVENKPPQQEHGLEGIDATTQAKI